MGALVQMKTGIGDQERNFGSGCPSHLYTYHVKSQIQGLFSCFQISKSYFHKCDASSSLLEPGSFSRADYLVCGCPGPKQAYSTVFCWKIPHTSDPSPRKEACVWKCMFESVFAHVPEWAHMPECVCVCVMHEDGWMHAHMCVHDKEMCVWVCSGVCQWVCTSEHAIVSTSVWAYTYMWVCICVPVCASVNWMSVNMCVCMSDCVVEWVFEWAWMWVSCKCVPMYLLEVSPAALAGGLGLKEKPEWLDSLTLPELTEKRIGSLNNWPQP